MTDFKYQIIRSSRKTLALEVKSTGLIVRAPYQATDPQIKDFVLRHSDWVEKHL